MSWALLLIILLPALFAFVRIFYNLYLHPLRRFPGPIHWASTSLPSAYSLCLGNLVHDIQELHSKYGDIVRVGPNAISFSRPDALRDILVHRSGHETFPKDGTWWDPIPGQADSVVSLPTGREHARIRKALSAGFTEKALIAQESILKKYVDLLIAKLREIVDVQNKSSKGSTVNIADWYNYTTFDIIGDLAFAEPFDCLRDSKYHPWIMVIFENLRAIAYLIAIRLVFRPLETMLFACLPAKATQAMDDHYNMSCRKIHRRLGLETARPDIMSCVLQQGGIRDLQASKSGSKDGGKGVEGSMTIPEIEGSFTTLIIAGSETTATALIGATNYLVNNPDKHEKLAAEIRGAFSADTEITLSGLKDLPYLNAVISETLRLCPPVPVGLAHVVPKGGDTVCGHWLPEGVSFSYFVRITYRRD
jgi:cytochrome P450